MKDKVLICIVLVVAMAVGFVVYQDAKVPAYLDEPLPLAQHRISDGLLVGIKPNQAVLSPLLLEGSAPGNWFFEGTFPVKILDAKGKVIGTAALQAQGDWMTADRVRFSGQILFQQPKTKTGQLIFSKDNPSGLPENDKNFIVPVLFEAVTAEQPSGTCAPNSENCGNDPKLCLEENKNSVCN